MNKMHFTFVIQEKEILNLRELVACIELKFNGISNEEMLI
jgi:hypothetical protein